MNGIIISFDSKSGKGLIRSQEGQRYTFHDGEWLDASRRPAAGQSIDFEVEGGEARQIAVLNAPNTNPIGSAGLSEGTTNGVILGSVSIVFGVLALMPGFGVLMAIIGAITGYIGRRQAKISDNANGKLLSIIGLSISIFILLVQVIAVLVLSSALFMI